MAAFMPPPGEVGPGGLDVGSAEHAALTGGHHPRQPQHLAHAAQGAGLGTDLHQPAHRAGILHPVRRGQPRHILARHPLHPQAAADAGKQPVQPDRAGAAGHPRVDQFVAHQRQPDAGGVVQRAQGVQRGHAQVLRLVDHQQPLAALQPGDQLALHARAAAGQLAEAQRQAHLLQRRRHPGGGRVMVAIQTFG
ncbi:hypothetical protein [Thermomonas sp. S9]|uniref:hypothetical protein n=1 Tax=Thermomonas sp. S9 TaxID=2885203 RepID=UPI00216B0552|nr:hypothetical protein [Thermomonas sp. S9]